MDQLEQYLGSVLPSEHETLLTFHLSYGKDGLCREGSVAVVSQSTNCLKCLQLLAWKVEEDGKVLMGTSAQSEHRFRELKSMGTVV